MNLKIKFFIYFNNIFKIISEDARIFMKKLLSKNIEKRPFAK